MISITLPFPNRILWPNGRTMNYRYKAALVREHVQWAYIGAMGHRYKLADLEMPYPLHWQVFPKTRNAIDKDNVIAAMKSYQDGFAQAWRINDTNFAAPTVSFSDPIQNGLVTAIIGPPTW
jgi:hypothetical protein